MSEDETIEKHGKHCGYCLRNTLLTYEYEFTCVSCGYNIIKRKHELSEIQWKKKQNSQKDQSMLSQKNKVFALMFVNFLRVLVMIKHLEFCRQ